MQGRGTILVADDDPDILSLVEESLGDEGYAVAAASSGDDAIAALAGAPFILVVSDAFATLTGGGLDYWTTLERIRGAAGTTPVIIFSAHTPSAFASFAERGFAAFVQKPFDLDTFGDLVRLTIADTNAR